MADQQMATYLQYGVASLKDQAVTLVTLYAASLAFLAAFSDRVLNITAAPPRVRGSVAVALWLLGGAIGCVLFTMLFAQSMIDQLSPWSMPKYPGATADTIARLSQNTRPDCEVALLLSVLFYLGALGAILVGFVYLNGKHLDEERQRKAEAAALSDNLPVAPESQPGSETQDD